MADKLDQGRITIEWVRNPSGDASDGSLFPTWEINSVPPLPDEQMAALLSEISALL